jgi:hypothetical protein
MYVVGTEAFLLLRGPYTINHVAQHCVLCNMIVRVCCWLTWSWMGKLVFRKTILRNMIDRVWAPLTPCYTLSRTSSIVRHHQTLTHIITSSLECPLDSIFNIPWETKSPYRISRWAHRDVCSVRLATHGMTYRQRYFRHSISCIRNVRCLIFTWEETALIRPSEAFGWCMWGQVHIHGISRCWRWSRH